MTVLDHAIFILTFAAAIGCGLIAGVFFAFSSFVMAALGRLSSDHGIATMNAINVTVINPGFMLLFLGSGVACLALAAGAVWRWSEGGAVLTLVAAAFYLVGCIGVTVPCNVPLNERLAAVAIGTPEADALWTRYLREWTFWNSVRTAASAAAAMLLIADLVAGS